MADIFEPRSEPARSIYRAFQAEALKRKGRTPEEWQHCEREAVLREACIQAAARNLRAPSMEDVVAAELSAMGHVDYGAKLAYGVVLAMGGK